MFIRLQDFARREKESCFFLGPRQTGKSTLIHQLFPEAKRYDLLLSNQYQRFLRDPSLLRQEVITLPPGQLIILDEVQKIPQLLDEIHWLMTNTRHSFILCGSSARKLKRGGANLLGGRALRYELFPLVSAEIPDFDLFRALNHGLLPRHYLADHVERLLEAYIGDYLREEIAAEALTRNIAGFSRFLEVAALSNGEIVNYHNIASECGVSLPTAKAYFQILEDTLLGRFLPSYQKKMKRRVIQSPKFYYFDVGIVNFLLRRGRIELGGEIFGRAFEHFIFQELTAHREYTKLQYPLSFWRTSSGLEVDFILGAHEVALEVKGTLEVKSHHIKGLCAFQEEYRPCRSIVVSLDPHPRQFGNVEVLPWKIFLQELWKGKIMTGIQ